MSTAPVSAGKDGPGALALSGAQLDQRRTAARRHGLYSRTETQVRNYRTGRLMRRLEVVLADQGRPLTEEMIPGVRSWAELGVISDGIFAVLIKELREEKTPSPRLIDAWRGLQRDRLQHATALGLTPVAKAELANSMTDLQRQLHSQEAHERLRAKQTQGPRRHPK